MEGKRNWLKQLIRWIFEIPTPQDEKSKLNKNNVEPNIQQIESVPTSNNNKETKNIGQNIDNNLLIKSELSKTKEKSKQLVKENTQDLNDNILFIDKKQGKINALNPFEELKNKLQDISGEWHSSIKLKSIEEGPITCVGNQCAGLTLEALLGIQMNSLTTPDFKGIEIKSYKRSPITLMTPQPDGGERTSMTFRDYLHTFGKKSARHKGRITFTGPFRVAPSNIKKDYELILVGYDSFKSRPSDFTDIFVGLYRVDDNKLVSSWSGNKLMEHWNKKHSEAFYVEYESKSVINDYGKNVLLYRYNGKSIYCRGTNITNFFKALEKNIVYYDPADEIYPNGKEKQRSQWRVSVPMFLKNMNILYDDTQIINLNN